MLIPSILAGILVGFVLGFLGAGGTVIGLPILLLFSNLHGHKVLGTNAAGVAMVATSIFVWRLIKNDVSVIMGIIFSIPGLLGIYTGTRLGLLYPGGEIIFLLGIVLFFIAGWMLHLSFRKESSNQKSAEFKQKNTKFKFTKRIWYLIIAAFIIGPVSGFFAIGGGFMIVPALILIAGMELNDAAGTALLPITLFAALVGLEYFEAGDVTITMSAIMIVPGIISGAFGIWLAKRLPKQIMQRIFSVFLMAIGFYILLR